MKKKIILMLAFLAFTIGLASCKSNKDLIADNNQQSTNDSGNTGDSLETPVEPGNTNNSNASTNESTNTGNNDGNGGNENTNSTPSNPAWDSVNSSDSISITESSGYLESAYVEWTGVQSAVSYNVYYKEQSATEYTKLDTPLIRLYSDHFRADVVGLKAGSYTLKIAPVFDSGEGSDAATANVTVISHDRSGFAFVNGTSSGAYNNDGSLKSNANVIYITQKTKDTVKLTSGSTAFTGLQEIISAHKKTITTPLCVRFIGNITDPSVLEKGDLLIDGVTGGITLEGIGEDTVINGFGIRIKGSSNVEVRNLATMNCNSDEGDNIGLQQDNDHVWVHNCDFFYGDAGSDADQVKGDGALDTKKSTYVTHSYNHFWDSGKSNLQGMKSETVDNKITYHHNWYDHSDSRHPRIRTCTVHVYNNFFDGNAKYGIGATMGCSVFAENNYFRNCKNPMLASKQGTDALGEGTFSGENGGIIKAFGNYIEGGNDVIYYNSSTLSFDAYLATSRDEVVPSTVVTVAGATSYNNFDTASDFYEYTVDTPDVAKEKIVKYAGRINGGDLKYEFNDETEDSNYEVISELKSMIVNYQTSLVQILGEELGGGDTSGSTGDDSGNTGDTSGSTDGDSGNTGDTSGSTGGTYEPASGTQTYNWTNTSNNSTIFTFVGSTSSKSATYDGVTYTSALKMNSDGRVYFNSGSCTKAKLIFVAASGKSLYVNGAAVDIPSDGVLEITLTANTDYEIKKKSGESYLVYIELSE